MRETMLAANENLPKRPILHRCSSGLLAHSVLASVRRRGFTYPCALLMRIDTRLKTFAIARSVALHHVVELGPVDSAEIVVAAFSVPLQIGIWNLQAKVFRLRHGLIDKFLA